LAGLVVPPQINAAMSGDSQALQEVLPDFSNMSNIEPKFNDDFQFNPADGTFSFSMNLTSPLDTPVTINSFSLTVTDENGSILGTVNSGNLVSLVPSQNSTIPVEGILSQELVTLLQNSGIDPNDPNFDPKNIEESGLDLGNINLTNVNLDIGGIQVHIDKLNPKDLFGSQEEAEG
jgi:hypothetical protein